MLVAVYGTLKQGYGNYHRYLEGRAKLVGVGHTVDKFVMIDQGFPVIQQREGAEDQHPVAIEVYDIGEGQKGRETLADLDRLEGEGYMYHRRQMDVVLPAKKKMKKRSRFTVGIYVGGEGFRNRKPSHDKYLKDGILSWSGYRG